MNKLFNNFFFILVIFTIFICMFFLPIYNDSDVKIIDFIEDGNILWPTPGISKINSYFGKRTAPTTGASTYHKGIDIGAPEGYEFIAVTNRNYNVCRIFRRWRIYNYSN